MAATPLNPATLSLEPQSYHPMLRESVHHFLSQLKSGFSDFSHFNLMFSRLIQTMPSPPLEVIWFYSAVNFHPHKNVIARDDKLGMVVALKELFQFLVSCSGSCSCSLKRVAVLAPLVYELYNLVCELKVQTRLSLDDVVVNREITCLMDGLVSYISMCSFEAVDDHDDSTALSQCFVDLVKVWTVGRRGSEFTFEDDVRMFFPVVSDEVRRRVLVGTTGIGDLAGMVMCQVFLLNLCLKFGSGELPKKLSEEVLNSAIDIITGFRSCYFFDTFLKVMLESSLPVASLLNCFDEAMLRQVLFDAVILVDYPFFNPGSGVRLCSHHLNKLASVWLFVADKALEMAGHNGDQTKAILYTKAFSKSLIHTQLLGWVFSLIGMAEDANKLDLFTPAAFIGWLVQLRSRASSALDTEFSMLLDKAMHHKYGMKCEPPLSGTNSSVKDTLIDQIEGGEGRCHRDLEMTDSTVDAAVISCCSSGFAALDPCRKRKGGQNEDDIQTKLFKYQIHDKPFKNFSPFQNDLDLGLIRRN